jgi:hypothetical protein
VTSINAYKLLLDTYRGVRTDGTTISLMLTEQCNFHCDHCFYGCGMHKPKGYMSSKNVLKAIDMAETLSSMNIRISINLIGGEPTLNLKEFKRIFDLVYTAWDPGNIDIEISTNGWWLKKASTAIKFFQVVERAACNAPGGIEEGFSVRISNDQYHRWQSNTDLEAQFNDLMETGAIYDDPVLYKEVPYCSKCNHEFKTRYPRRCPKCGTWDDIYYEYETLIELPPTDLDQLCWIFVQSNKYDNGVDGIIPSGERGHFGRNIKTCGVTDVLYSNADKLTFLPNGKHTDGCCKGSLMPFGDLDDNPFILLALNHQFTVECEPTCLTCRSDAAQWAIDRMPEIKKDLIKAYPQFEADGSACEWEWDEDVLENTTNYFLETVE